MLEDFVRRASLDKSALVHDRQFSADLSNHLEIVRNENQTEVVAPAQPGDEIENLSLNRQVEGRGRFVEDQQSRFGSEGSGNRDTLAFST